MTEFYSATFFLILCSVLRMRWIRNITFPPSLHLFLCWYYKLLIIAFSLPNLPPNEVLLSKEMHLGGVVHILCIFNKASVLEPVFMSYHILVPFSMLNTSPVGLSGSVLNEAHFLKMRCLWTHLCFQCGRKKES